MSAAETPRCARMHVVAWDWVVNMEWFKVRRSTVSHYDIDMTKWISGERIEGTTSTLVRRCSKQSAGRCIKPKRQPVAIGWAIGELS